MASPRAAPSEAGAVRTDSRSSHGDARDESSSSPVAAPSHHGYTTLRPCLQRDGELSRDFRSAPTAALFRRRRRSRGMRVPRYCRGSIGSHEGGVPGCVVRRSRARHTLPRDVVPRFSPLACGKKLISIPPPAAWATKWPRSRPRLDQLAGTGMKPDWRETSRRESGAREQPHTATTRSSPIRSLDDDGAASNR